MWQLPVMQPCEEYVGYLWDPRWNDTGMEWPLGLLAVGLLWPSTDSRLWPAKLAPVDGDFTSEPVLPIPGCRRFNSDTLLPRPARGTTLDWQRSYKPQGLLPFVHYATIGNRFSLYLVAYKLLQAWSYKKAYGKWNLAQSHGQIWQNCGDQLFWVLSYHFC